MKTTKTILENWSHLCLTTMYRKIVWFHIIKILNSFQNIIEANHACTCMYMYMHACTIFAFQKSKEIVEHIETWYFVCGSYTNQKNCILLQNLSDRTIEKNIFISKYGIILSDIFWFFKRRKINLFLPD